MGGVISGTKHPRVPEKGGGPVQPEVVRKVVAAAQLQSFKTPMRKALAMGSMSRSFDKLAATNIYLLAQDGDETRNEVVREGGLLPLIGLFQSKVPEVQEQCLLAISELCKSEECRIQILQVGGCSPIIQGLESEHANVLDAALEAMEHLGELQDALVKLVQEGAVPRLHFLLDTCNEAAFQRQVKALRALSSMSLLPCNLARMDADDTVRTMFNTAHSSVFFPEHRATALAILTRLIAAVPTARARLMAVNGGTGLQRIVALAASMDDGVAVAAVAALGSLSVDPDIAMLLMDKGALVPLRRLLRPRSATLPGAAAAATAAALQALVALAECSPAVRQAIRDSDGLVGRTLRLAQAGGGGEAECGGGSGLRGSAIQLLGLLAADADGDAGESFVAPDAADAAPGPAAMGTAIPLAAY